MQNAQCYACRELKITNASCGNKECNFTLCNECEREWKKESYFCPQCGVENVKIIYTKGIQEMEMHKDSSSVDESGMTENQEIENAPNPVAQAKQKRRECIYGCVICLVVVGIVSAIILLFSLRAIIDRAQCKVIINSHNNSTQEYTKCIKEYGNNL